ncbi:ABC transporter permease [Candidatus Bathyarchaeota archaeon]|nr:MAG: ABC transporter permease [Candidatus Bathyarchaeota archaeon]
MSYRFRNLTSYALNCIQRYKTRTIVILVCLTLSSGLFSSVLIMKDGLIREGQLSLKYAPDITVQGVSSGRPAYVETRLIDPIKTIWGVDRIIERIWGYGNIGDTLIVVIGVQLENPIIDLNSTYPLESGSFLNPQENNTVVIGKGVAELLGAKIGNYLSIVSESNQVHQFTIVGIFNSESAIINADTILMSNNNARSFFNVPADRATDLLVYTKEVDTGLYELQVNFVAREISEFPNVRVVTRDILLSAQETTYGARSGFFSIVWYLVLISVAVVAFNQTVVVGHESKFEIGLLKAFGFSTSDIILIRLIEGTVLGLIAGSLGMIFGVLYIVIFNAPVLRDVMLGWAILYPSFNAPFSVNMQSILVTYAITVIPIIFATVIPSWLNAAVDPDLAMRGARA